MALNVTTAVFRPGFNIATASPSLVQWDQGQTLQFEGVELPSAYQVEFTNAVTVQAITMIGNEDGVEIPNELLQQSFPINAYIVLHETAEDRETEYWATIYVKARQKPREETPDPEQSSVIDQTIAALQEGVAEAQAAANEAEAASQAVQDMGVEAETLPEESAATVEKTVDPETGVVTLTFGIPKGAKGNKGDKGNPGETYLLAPSVDTIVKNPNTGTFIPAQIVFTVYKVVNGTSSPYRAAAIVADIFGSGMVPHYEVVNDYRLTVPINSIADTGYVACSAYGNGGIIATITIPCILDGAKGDPGEGVAPNGTTGQFLKKKSGEDYDTEWADVDPGVTSVNGKTGAVTLTASDVGAKPASYEAPVSSVNEKTGAVVLDAGDIGYESTTVEDELGTINSALTSLQSVTEIIDTASGAIASFPDGSGLPMRSLVAEINPVQDLHGQDAPYPAGGGKNVFQSYAESQTLGGVTFTANADGTITANGTATSDLIYEINKLGEGSPTGGVYCHLSDMGIKADTSYILNGDTAGAYNSTHWVQMLVYGSGAEPYSADHDSNPFSFSESDISSKWYRMAIRVKSGTQLSNFVFKPMIRLASVTDATFAPYSNICPISGWTGLSGQRTGVNQWDEEWEVGALDSSGAVDASLTTRRTTSFISVVESNSYYMPTPCLNGRYAYYDAEKNLVSYNGNGFNTYVNTVPSGAYYLRITLASSYSTTYNHDISINYPSTNTSYHAYTGEPISVSWQDEAGTVYGGSDEIVGGELTSDRGKMVATNDGNWRFDAAGGSYNYVYYHGATIPNDLTKLLCNIAPTVSNTADFGITRSGGGFIQIYVNALGITSLAEWNTYITNNTVEIVYPLATPQSFTHEGQSVDTLVGQNNVFVDTGNVSVTYQASIKGYIDKVLAS